MEPLQSTGSLDSTSLSLSWPVWNRTTLESTKLRSIVSPLTSMWSQIQSQLIRASPQMMAPTLTVSTLRGAVGTPSKRCSRSLSTSNCSPRCLFCTWFQTMRIWLHRDTPTLVPCTRLLSDRESSPLLVTPPISCSTCSWTCRRDTPKIIGSNVELPWSVLSMIEQINLSDGRKKVEVLEGIKGG